MIDVEVTGIDRFRENATRANRRLRELADDATRQLAAQTLQWLLAQIMTRNLSLAPVHGQYADRKDPGLPELVNTTEYVKSFMIKRVRSGSWQVDLKTDEMRRRAIWLEYGTRSFPPRLHWRPAADFASRELGPRIGRVALDKYAEELVR